MADPLTTRQVPPFKQFIFAQELLLPDDVWQIEPEYPGRQVQIYGLFSSFVDVHKPPFRHGPLLHGLSLNNLIKLLIKKAVGKFSYSKFFRKIFSFIEAYI